MDENTRLLIEFIGFCVVVFFIRRFGLRDQKQPLEPIPCKVVSTRNEKVEVNGWQFTHRFVTFEKVPWGEQFEVQVLRDDFRKLQIGDEGIVHLRNSRFIKFEKTNSDNPN